MFAFFVRVRVLSSPSFLLGFCCFLGVWRFFCKRQFAKCNHHGGAGSDQDCHLLHRGLAGITAAVGFYCRGKNPGRPAVSGAIGGTFLSADATAKSSAHSSGPGVVRRSHPYSFCCAVSSTFVTHQCSNNSNENSPWRNPRHFDIHLVRLVTDAQRPHLWLDW